jgi:predicted ATPase/DNA-binding CsgD family transcriptional regulator/transcriptional regulator with XRE-family HTH domain
MSRPNTTFAELLRRHRLLTGLSQEGLAERGRLSVSAVGALERGVNRQPHPRTVSLLAEALGLSPEQRTELIHAARPILSNGSVQLDSPETRHGTGTAVAASRSNLPTPATSLVGREREVATARECLFRPEVRLLTFTGPGGVGKTRLALAVAAGVVDAFDDGVHFVDLAPLNDPGHVHAAIARSLGIQDAGDQPLADTLRLYLQSRCLLLVLDNFEQVVDAAALVADLLAACPALKIAATSREPLYLSWEHVWPVLPLALPPAADAADCDRIAASPAVALFVERARATRPDFALTDENARIVAEICARLDGLPLAIELAAARVPLLPLAAIRTRLQQRLSLLTGGPRDAPVRHHTLRTAIAWSYGLLDPAQQAAFRRLAVFVGGFTLEAAEAMCAAGEPGDVAISHPNAMVDRLQSIVDKSLLRSDAATDGEPRFRMLETIREFGLEQLSTSGDLDAVQERHARIFLALAEEGERSLVERVQEVWLDRLEAEYDNLRAAFDWSLTAPEGTEIGARLASALQLFWQMRGHLSTGRAWYEWILARDDAAASSPRLRVKVLWGAAFLAWRQGDYAAATRLSDEGVALGSALPDPSELVFCLAVRGLVACHQAQYALAHAALDRGLVLARDTHDERAYAYLLAIGSTLGCIEGEYARARSLGEESLGLFRTRRELWGIAMNLDTLGSVARRQGHYHVARSLHEESIVASQALGDKGAMAVSHANLGHVARALGDDETARARYAESLHLHREVGDRRGIALALGNLGVLARRTGDLDRAWDDLRESLAVARAVGDKRILTGALNHHASLALARRDLPAATTGYAESLRLFVELRDARGLAHALAGCANLLFITDRPESALELCALGDALLTSLRARRSPADQAGFDELRARLREAVGPAFSTQVMPGAADLNLDRVVARALALLEAEPISTAPLHPEHSKSDAHPLSRREREIALLVVRGLTNRAIAAELVISERTVETHVSNILGKLRLETRAQLAVWAVARRLIPT